MLSSLNRPQSRERAFRGSVDMTWTCLSSRQLGLSRLLLPSRQGVPGTIRSHARPLLRTPPVFTFLRRLVLLFLSLPRCHLVELHEPQESDPETDRYLVPLDLGVPPRLPKAG